MPEFSVNKNYEKTSGLLDSLAAISNTYKTAEKPEDIYLTLQEEKILDKWNQLYESSNAIKDISELKKSIKELDGFINKINDIVRSPGVKRFIEWVKKNSNSFSIEKLDKLEQLIRLNYDSFNNVFINVAEDLVKIQGLNKFDKIQASINKILINKLEMCLETNDDKILINTFDETKDFLEKLVEGNGGWWDLDPLKLIEDFLFGNSSSHFLSKSNYFSKFYDSFNRELESSNYSDIIEDMNKIGSEFVEIYNYSEDNYFDPLDEEEEQHILKTWLKKIKFNDGIETYREYLDDYLASLKMKRRLADFYSNFTDDLVEDSQDYLVNLPSQLKTKIEQDLKKLSESKVNYLKIDFRSINKFEDLKKRYDSETRILDLIESENQNIKQEISEDIESFHSKMKSRNSELKLVCGEIDSVSNNLFIELNAAVLQVKLEDEWIEYLGCVSEAYKLFKEFELKSIKLLEEKLDLDQQALLGYIKENDEINEENISNCKKWLNEENLKKLSELKLIKISIRITDEL